MKNDLYLIICEDDWTCIIPTIAESREEALQKVAESIIREAEHPMMQPHADWITGGGTPNAELKMHAVGDPDTCCIKLTTPFDSLHRNQLIGHAEKLDKANGVGYRKRHTFQERHDANHDQSQSVRFREPLH